MVYVEGLSLRAVVHHYHVGHSTIVRALERTDSSPEAGLGMGRTRLNWLSRRVMQV